MSRLPLTPDDPRHGTYAGLMAHNKQAVPVCNRCRAAGAAYMRRHRRRRNPLTAVYDESEIALTGGRWVRHGLTMRWEASEVPEPDPRPRFTFADLIACPTCHATIVQGCRSEGGRPREPHVNRLITRRCPCGASLAPRKRMCEPCRVEARLETHRRYDEQRDRGAA